MYSDWKTEALLDELIQLVRSEKVLGMGKADGIDLIRAEISRRIGHLKSEVNVADRYDAAQKAYSDEVSD